MPLSFIQIMSATVFLVPGRTTASTPSRSFPSSTNTIDTSSRNRGSRSVKFAMRGYLTTPMRDLPSPFLLIPLRDSESSLGRTTSAWGIMPITGMPVSSSSFLAPGLMLSRFPRTLLRMIPLTRFLSSSGSSSTVPMA